MDEAGESAALIIVDVLNKVCPGGALATPDSGMANPVLNQWIKAVGKLQDMILASRDRSKSPIERFQGNQAMGCIRMPASYRDSRPLSL